MIETIKKDLPNFPDEVIKLWIEPYAHDIGWPPDHKRWRGILFDKNIKFWKNTKWEKVNLNLADSLFSKETMECFLGMEDSYIRGKTNGYSAVTNGKNRFMSALKYLMENGSFPEPVCLLFQNGGYSVVDGNHRTLAWKSYGTIMNVLNNLKDCGNIDEVESFKKTIKEKWNVDNLAPFSGEQEVWVAYE